MAKFLAWSDELESALAEPFPAEWVKSKKAGKGDKSATISFVPWYRYVSKLNELVGQGWSMGHPITMHVGDKLVMGIPLTIFGTTRINWGDEDDSEWETVVDHQTGEEVEKKTMYGSPVTNAFAQAFKRSCALFGMGLDMYDKGRPAAQSQKPANAPQKKAESAPPACPKCGGKMWDNRPKKASGEFKPTSPDFACRDKACKHAVWLKDEAEGVSVEKLQDALNKAAAVGAVTPDEVERVEKVIAESESEHMEAALDWLKTQMDKRKMGAGA